MKKYTTYLFAADPKGPYCKTIPELFGEKCVGISNTDVFEERDDAMSLLAKIYYDEEVILNSEYFSETVRDKIGAFFKARGYENTYGTLIKD